MSDLEEGLYRKITLVELKKKLHDHQIFLKELRAKGEVTSQTCSLCADFSRADLSYLDLQGQDLEEADFNTARLRGTNLQNANLKGAFLCSADFENADLRNADLRNTNCGNGTNFRGGNLEGADFTGAIECDEAHFDEEQLQKANFSNTVLDSKKRKAAYIKYIKRITELEEQTNKLQEKIKGAS